MERGEGLAGRLTSDEGDELTHSIVETMKTVERVAHQIERSQGPLGRLINDDELGEDLANAVSGLEDLVSEARGGDGLVPRLISDPATADRFDTVLAELEGAATALRSFASEVEGSNGLAQKLLTDEAYADEVGENLRQLIERLNGVAGKLESGEGSAARLINDPQVYDALNDVIVGNNETRFLGWLTPTRPEMGIYARSVVAFGPVGPPPGEPPPEPPS
jgi:phospholipid/cholesterol/gamma-HCH transport system substrate-binding protein